MSAFFLDLPKNTAHTQILLVPPFRVRPMLAVLLLLVALTSSNEFGRKEGAVIELQDDSAPIASRCPKGADAAEEGTVASCLANRGAQCDAEARSCAAGLYPRACMFAKIPVGTPFSRIQCCFACCLKVWMGRFGLLDNDRYWSAARGGTKNTNGPVDAVHGATSSTTLSSIVYNYHRGKTGWRRGGKECVHGNCTVPHGGIVTVNKAICGRGDRQYHQCNLEYFAKQRVPHMGGAPFVLVTTTDLKLPRSALPALAVPLPLPRPKLMRFVPLLSLGRPQLHAQLCTLRPVACGQPAPAFVVREQS